MFMKPSTIVRRKNSLVDYDSYLLDDANFLLDALVSPPFNHIALEYDQSWSEASIGL